jgi:capsule polysaccharide export protein KpsE/RkpR
MLGGELGGLAAGLDTSMAGTADATKVAAVLQSVSVTDAVIARFDLLHRYGEKHPEDARNELWRHCDVKTLLKPNLVTMTCEDGDPAFAQAMLSYFAEYGNRVFRRVSASSATEEVRFLEKRTSELRQLADEAATRMREFQEQHHIVDLDAQARAVVSALAGLNSQSIAKQVELGYARTFSSNDEATIRQLQSQIGVLGEKLHGLEEPREEPAPPADPKARGFRSAGGGVFPGALEVPRLRAEFERLYRERRVAEVTLVYALERLEGARANEARDVSTFVVLDEPPLPTRHSRPRRLVVVLGAGLLGLGLAIADEWRRSGPRAGAAPRALPGAAPRPLAAAERTETPTRG